MSEVADATIEQYETQARRLARDHDLSAPLLPLLLDTRRLRDRVTARLRGHTRLDQARDLYLLASQVCGLLAWETADLGDYRAADTHAWTAWMCAEQAGHDSARAWVRATQSKLPTHIRNDPMLQDLDRVRRLLAKPAYAEAPVALDAQEEIEDFRREALPRQVAS